MALDIAKLGGQNIEQLSLGLNLEEIQIEGEGFIDPAEAQRRADVALQALKVRISTDRIAEEAYPEKIKAYYRELNEREKQKLSHEDLEKPEEPKSLPWANDLYFLLDHGWPWRVAVYIAWAGSPKSGRWPKTQEDLANQVLGLNSDRQISEWRRNNPAIDEMIGIMQAMPLLDHRRDIFEALAESASNPSHRGAQDRKTALTMTGDYVPRQKVDIDRPKMGPQDYKEEDLAKMAARLDEEYSAGTANETEEGENR